MPYVVIKRQFTFNTGYRLPTIEEFIKGYEGIIKWGDSTTEEFEKEIDAVRAYWATGIEPYAYWDEYWDEWVGEAKELVEYDNMGAATMEYENSKLPVLLNLCINRSK